MKRYTVLIAAVAVLGLLVWGRSRLNQPTPITAESFLHAPATVDPGPVTALPALPPEAIAFDLKYRGQTGATNEIEYHAYWGFGEADEVNDPFLQEVRKRTTKLSYIPNSSLKGRKWSAVEHEGRKIIALYFDLNADGKLADNECILPTRQADKDSLEFITPDFTLTTDDGKDVQFRVLLRISYYARNREPNFMWSPAGVLEGTASIDGEPARMVLFANGFGAGFDQFGSASYGWLVGSLEPAPNSYFPRETLSSLIYRAGKYYRLKFEGRTGLGHVARAVLTPDASPTGRLAVKLTSTNALETKVTHLNLQGVNDRTIYLNLDRMAQKIPMGAYHLKYGKLTYGTQAQPGWQISFSEGPQATLQPDQSVEVALGEPVLNVRAIREQDRYVSDAKPITVMQRGTQLYLEPKIIGKGKEVLTRFERQTGNGSQTTSVPPMIRITGPDGQEVLSQKMEYG